MKTIQIKLDDLTHRKAKVAAYTVGLTLGDYVRVAIEEKVEGYEETEPCPESGSRRLQ